MRPIGTIVNTQRILRMSGLKSVLPKNAVDAFAGGDCSCKEGPCFTEGLIDESAPSSGKDFGEQGAFNQDTAAYICKREYKINDCNGESFWTGAPYDCEKQGGDEGEGEGDGGGGSGGGGSGGGGSGGGGSGGGGSGGGGTGDGGTGDGGTGDGGTGDGGTGGGGTEGTGTTGPLSPEEEAELSSLIEKIFNNEALTQEEIDRVNELRNRLIDYGTTGTTGTGTGGGGGDITSIPTQESPTYPSGEYPPGGYNNYVCCDLDVFGKPYYTYTRQPCVDNCLDYSDPGGVYTNPVSGTAGSSDAWGGGTTFPSTGPTGVSGTLTDSNTSVNLPVVPLPGGISTIGGSLASVISGITGDTPLKDAVKVPGSNVPLAGSDIISKIGGTIKDGKLTIPASLTGPTATEAATAARNILPFLGLALLLFRR